MNSRDFRDRLPLAASPPDLVDLILERTSRSPCERTQKRLCELVDGTLEGPGAQRVRRHLSECRECRRLAAVLTALAEDLPAATLPWEERLARGWERLVDAWGRLLRRPRFTLEAAYVGTMIVALVFLSPLSPFRQLPAQALTAARIDTAEALSELSAPVATVRSRVLDFGHQAWDAITTRGLDSYAKVEGELADRSHRVGEAAQDLRRHAGELGAATLDLSLKESSEALKRMTDDLDSIWQRILSGREDTFDQPEPELNAEPRRPS